MNYKNKELKKDLFLVVTLLMTGLIFIILGFYLKTKPTFFRGFLSGFFSVALIFIIYSFWFRRKKGKSVTSTADEREQLLLAKAGAISYNIFVIMIGTFVFLTFSTEVKWNISLSTFGLYMLGSMLCLYSVVLVILKRIY